MNTDACTCELGFEAVLEQEGEDGHRHPIAFASCQTNEAEKSMPQLRWRLQPWFLQLNTLKYIYWVTR